MFLFGTESGLEEGKKKRRKEEKNCFYNNLWGYGNAVVFGRSFLGLFQFYAAFYVSGKGGKPLFFGIKLYMRKKMKEKQKSC